MMRKLMYVTLGFGMSCALFAYLLPREVLGILLTVSGMAGLVLAVLGRTRPALRRAALLLLGCAAGCLWFGQFYRGYLDAAVTVDGQVLETSIHVTDYSYETDYGSAVEGKVTIAGKAYQAKAYLKDFPELKPGQEVTGAFRFRITTPDGEEAATYHQGRGLFLLLYQKETITISEGEATWEERVAVLQDRIKTILETAFPADVFPFAKALLLGDTQDLGYEVDSAFKISGIRHVVAVSGLHVAILFTLLSTLTFKNRFLTAILGFPMLLTFAALAGFTPSVVRSCLMLSLTLLGLLLEKEYDGPTALAFAVLVMLLCNPLTITDIGFQLSVGSVAGIFAFSPSITAWVKGLFGKTGRAVSWLASSVGITLSAMTITTPLCAWYFGTVSLVGVVTNLLVLWVISFIFYGILAVCLLGILWPGAAAVAAWAIAWPIRYVLLVAKTLASFPLAAVYTRSPAIVCWLLFAYLLVLLLWMGRLKPGKGFCLGILGLCLALLVCWYPSMAGEVRFTMLDVGQGQSILVQSEGKAILVDCGGDSDGAAADQAAQALLSQGISRLDALIVTHADRDHAGGVQNLLTRVDTGLLVLPQDGDSLEGSTRGRVLCPEEDMVLSFGQTKVSVFVPRFPGDSNEISLCVLFDTPKCDILITGDRNGFGERSLLRNASIPDVDVLVAGHHGAKDSTCQELLDAVKPEVVCISAGLDNPYGHPSGDVLQRLEMAGCTVYRTDLDGEICIRR